MKKRGIKILHVISREIRILDIPRVLDELGYDVYTANLDTQTMGFYEDDSRKIQNAIEEFQIDCVTGYDFSESISHACMKKNIPYIAWVYDAPQKELYTNYAMYPCNYIFVFDKMQLKRMKDIGIQNVYFMPLAIHGEKIKRELKMEQPSELCDVAFVGSTYYHEIIEKDIDCAPEYIRKEIKECIDKCFMQWGDDKGLHGRLSERCAIYFDKLGPKKIEDRYPYITKEFYYEAAVLSRMLAYRERVYILNTLAEKYDVRLYTFNKHVEELNDKVKVCPGIKYDGGISCVYRDAKININNTLHCIETGACMRVFEVMAAGGFLISNYQKELEELFVPGKEIVLYHNEEELLQLVDYYLKHEDERKEIARNGQRKVLKEHTLHLRFRQIMQIVYEKEKGRKEGYFETQRKELINFTNDSLKNGQKEDFEALYKCYHQPSYNFAIEQNSELSVMKDMISLWKEISILNDTELFNGIQNIESAVHRYLRAKFVLYRIENDCNYEACMSCLQELLEENTPCILMAWHIMNLSEKRDMYLKLSEYLWSLNKSRGLEMISYGLFEFPDDVDMIMYKANYLLELQCYKEALDTLKGIQSPNEEILEIMEELEKALEIV